MARRSDPISIPGIVIQPSAPDNFEDEPRLTSSRLRSKSTESLVDDDDVFLAPGKVKRGQEHPSKLTPDWNKENVGPAIRRASAKRKCPSTPPEAMEVKATRMTLYPSVSNSPR